jgi:hypothetical protein
VGSVIVPAMLPKPCPCAEFDDKVEKTTRLISARTKFLFILVPFQERVATANVRPVPKAAVLTGHVPQAIRISGDEAYRYSDTTPSRWF